MAWAYAAAELRPSESGGGSCRRGLQGYVPLLRLLSSLLSPVGGGRGDGRHIENEVDDGGCRCWTRRLIDKKATTTRAPWGQTWSAGKVGPSSPSRRCCPFCSLTGVGRGTRGGLWEWGCAVWGPDSIAGPMQTLSRRSAHHAASPNTRFARHSLVARSSQERSSGENVAVQISASVSRAERHGDAM